MSDSFRVKSYTIININDVLELEKISDCKFTLFQRIFFIDSGITQRLLGALMNSKINFRIIQRSETKNTIRRKSLMLSLKHEKILDANSIIYKRNTPTFLLKGLRKSEIGLGQIIVKNKMETFKKINEIGCINQELIFRKYDLFHKEKIICKIKETLLFKI